MSSTPDTIFMERALKLAESGRGWVSPNPLVGAVLVKNDRIIGEGYHARYGEKHAEVVALDDARAKGHDSRGATLYVTLEPCNHTGHQPPCTPQILKAGIAKVVYAITDPNPAVTGGGSKILQTNGVKIEVGMLKAEALEQNKIWLHWITTKKPYVCVKVAVSLDNKITKKVGTTTQVSGSEAQHFSHTLRQRYDAILVGANTVLIDKPILSTRLPADRHGLSDSAAPLHQPLRIIVDGHLAISPDAGVLRDAHCLVLTTDVASPAKLAAIKKKMTVAVIPGDKGHISIADILHELERRFITSVLVEGGAETLQQFFDDEVVQEWLIIRSGETFGAGLDFITDPKQFTKKFVLEKSTAAGPDTIEHYIPLVKKAKKE